MVKGLRHAHLQRGAQRAQPGAAYRPAYRRELSRKRAGPRPRTCLREAPQARGLVLKLKSIPSARRTVDPESGRCREPGLTLSPRTPELRGWAPLPPRLLLLRPHKGFRVTGYLECPCSYLTGYSQTYIFERVSPFKEKLWSWLAMLYLIHPNSLSDARCEEPKGTSKRTRAAQRRGGGGAALTPNPCPQPPFSVRPTCPATADWDTDREAQTRTHHGSTKAKKKSVKIWLVPSHLPRRSNTFEV